MIDSPLKYIVCFQGTVVPSDGLYLFLLEFI